MISVYDFRYMFAYVCTVLGHHINVLQSEMSERQQTWLSSKNCISSIPHYISLATANTHVPSLYEFFMKTKTLKCFIKAWLSKSVIS